MAFDQALAARIRSALARRKNIGEVKMFGAFCFKFNGNLLVGVWKSSLIARLGPEAAAYDLLEPHVRKFDVTGKPMRNWVLVGPEGVGIDDQLKEWIERATKFVKTLPAKE